MQKRPPRGGRALPGALRAVNPGGIGGTFRASAIPGFRLHESLHAHPVFGPLSALTSALCAQYRCYREISAGEAVLVDMGAVSPSEGGAGIYRSMRRDVHWIAQARGFRYAVGEFSSATTQHVILNRLQHRKVAEVRLDAFEYGGGYPFRAISDPPSIILAEGRLQEFT